MRQPPIYTDSGDDRRMSEATRLMLARELCQIVPPRSRQAGSSNRMNKRINYLRAEAIIYGIGLVVMVIAGIVLGSMIFPR